VPGALAKTVGQRKLIGGWLDVLAIERREGFLASLGSDDQGIGDIGNVLQGRTLEIEFQQTDEFDKLNGLMDNGSQHRAPPAVVLVVDT